MKGMLLAITVFVFAEKRYMCIAIICSLMGTSRAIVRNVSVEMINMVLIARRCHVRCSCRCFTGLYRVYSVIVLTNVK